jgi:hypothetical protein
LLCSRQSLRRGALPEAQQLCIEANQHWRAASLSGGAFWETGADDTGTPTRNGNPFRLLWKLMQWQNSEALRQEYDCAAAPARTVALYERTIAARMGGNPYTLLSSPLVSTWWDALWGLLNAVLDARFTRQVVEHRRRQLGRTKHVPQALPDVCVVDDDGSLKELLGLLEHKDLPLTTMTVDGVFSVLGKSLLGEWTSKGGSSPFGRLQAMAVLTAVNRSKYEAEMYQTLRRVVLEVSPVANRPGEVHLVFPHVCSEADPEAVPVLRFAATYVESHRITVPTGMQEAVFDRLCDDVLVVYARHLIATLQIRGAVSHLGNVKAVGRILRECANLMHFIGPAHLRQEFRAVFSKLFGNPYSVCSVPLRKHTQE